MIVLHGWRRLYTDPTTGVISGAYQPGELMQGLCSPWQHDFRDCYCHYWASNRPDLVFGDVYPGEPSCRTAKPSIRRSMCGWIGCAPTVRGRWRWRPLASSRKIGPISSTTYQINHEWQNLNIVLEGREINSVRLSEPIDAANRLPDAGEACGVLRDFLAPLELTLVFEYLFALFSLRNPDDVSDAALRDALTLAREYLLLICDERDATSALGQRNSVGAPKAGKLRPMCRSSIGRVGASRVRWSCRQPTRTREFIGYIEGRAQGPISSTPDAAATATAVCGLPATSQPRDAKQRNSGADPDDLRSGCASSRRCSRTSSTSSTRVRFIDSTYARVAATLGQAGNIPPHLVGLAERILQRRHATREPIHRDQGRAQSRSRT